MTRPLRARLGMSGHAAVLARIKSSPCTHDDLIAEDLIGSTSDGYCLLGSLHRLMRIHVSAWREERGRTLRAVWSYGLGEDAPCPTTRANGLRKAQSGFIPTVQCIPPAYLAFDMLLTELEAPRTHLELSEITGLDPRTVRTTVAALGPLLRKVGRRKKSTLWQLAESVAPRNSRLATGAAYRSAPSVFKLGAALRKELEAA